MEYGRSALTAWVATADHDRLIAIAQQNECSVSRVVRSMLRRQLEAAQTPKPPPK